MLRRSPLFDAISSGISLVSPLVNVELGEILNFFLNLGLINVISLEISNLLNVMMAILVRVRRC
jgi:hypothetical protein